MIKVSGLTKNYGLRCAISDLNFSIEKGEIVGFLGPNGAGKTTTMRIMTGYLPPSSGTVTIGGYDIIDNSLEIRKIVGYLPETVPLYLDMSVFDYLKFMADLRHLKNPEDAVDEALEKVDLTTRSNSFIGNLSKGMRQRVGLAQALIHNPDVLILDEPTIGLDPAQVVAIRNLIKELGKERTIILSTHILSEAQQVCNRVMIINKGKIVAEDSPEHLQIRLTGSQRVRTKVRADSQEIANLIQSISGVVNVFVTDPNTVEFETLNGAEVQPAVARKIIKEGYDLLELYPITMSLEDIFLQLTRDETPVSEIKEGESQAEFETEGDD